MKIKKKEKRIGVPRKKTILINSWHDLHTMRMHPMATKHPTTERKQKINCMI
jgi:hypothetical protein